MEPRPPDGPGPGCLLALLASLVLWGLLLAGTYLAARGIHHVLHH